MLGCLPAGPPISDGDARSFGFLTDSHDRDFYCVLKCPDDGETGGAQFCHRARFRRWSSSSAYIVTRSYHTRRDADMYRTPRHAPTTYIVTHPVCRNTVILCTPRHRHTSYIATRSYHVRRDTDIHRTSRHAPTTHVATPTYPRTSRWGRQKLRIFDRVAW